MEHTGASFPEAVRSLAANAGMSVPEEPRSPQQRAATQRHKQEASQHQQILDAAQRHYLSELKVSAAAIAYLKKRGLNGQIAARFGLGWSGADRRGLATVFPHYEEPLLIESGLVIESEDGRRYDRFRERVMFPIRNARGHLIGFGGRIIGRGEPKYLNSPETALFSKGRELYGLWEGRAGIRAEGYVLVVEGYMDVVGLAQQGIENAVATLGTATTVEHIQKLLRTSDKIIFSFDGDGAGRRAAWRALQVCLPMLRDDVSIRFLFLPPEHDPDSYVREYGAEAFRACVAEAMPLSRFMLEELASRHAMDEAEGRAACVHEAKPLLASLPEGTVLRVQIEREFARLVQLTPEELAAMLAAAPAFKAALTIAPQPGEYDSARPNASPQRAGMPGPSLDDEPYFESAPAGELQPRSAGRARRGANRHSVMPMAKRLLRLLLAHPALVDNLGDQQLEVLEHGPHLIMVRELLALAHASGARHVGALLQAADPGSDLAEVLSALSIELLSQDDLPDPQTEWNDALCRIEIETLEAEQSSLIKAGLHDDMARKRYQEITGQIKLLRNVSSH